MKYLKAFEHFVVPENIDAENKKCSCEEGCENCECPNGGCDGCRCASKISEKKSESGWSVLVDGKEKGMEDSPKDAKAKAKEIAGKNITWIKTKNGFRSEPGTTYGKIKKIEIVEVVDMSGGKRSAAGVKSHLKSRKTDAKSKRKEPITERKRH